MIAYIGRRLAIAVPILVGITLVVFVMLHSAGGDPAVVMLGMKATDASLAALRHELGIDRPLAVQYLDFLGHAVRGDLGASYRTQTAVAPTVLSRFPATIELALAAIAIGISVGLPAGVIAATRRNSWFDYSSTLVALIGVSIPTFWLGLMGMIVFGVELKWLPISGRVDPRLGVPKDVDFIVAWALFHGHWVILRDTLEHLVLPALTLAGWPAAIIARMTRAAMIETLDQDYIRTARAKGLLERVVVGRHALRNALIPVLTVLGLEFGGLLGGAFVTEQVFAWPGIGKLTVDAITNRDYQVVQGVVILSGVVFIALNLLVDVLYGALDPRIRFR